MSDAPIPEEPETAPMDLGTMERTISRAVFFLAMATLVVTMLFTEERKTPAPALLAIVSVFVVAKLVVLVIGLRRRWNQVPAVALQVAAFATIGWIIYAGLTSAVPLVIVAVLLVGAALWRRRVTQREDEE